MEKEKGKKEVQFNPADYDYMDNMPLEGWVWEFIRRSDKYRSKFREFETKVGEYCIALSPKSKKSLEEMKKIHERATYLIDEVNDDTGVGDEAFLTSENFFVRIKDGVLQIGPQGQEQDDFYKLYLFFPRIIRRCTKKDFPHLPTERIAELGKMRVWGNGLPRPQFKYSDFQTSITPTINHVSCSKCWTFEQIRIEENEHKSILHMLAPSKLEDTLYIGISRTASIKELEKKVLPNIKRYLKTPPKTVRLRTREWKYYLITYDLSRTGKTNSEIADILAQAYPSEKKLYAEKNVENYVKNASYLINGGYKKYMLEK